MRTHWEQEMIILKKAVAKQAERVEWAVHQSLNALEQKNVNLLLDIIGQDDEIDREEVRLEEECLKVLALHQPVAGDLRYIITLLKVNTELERIGDLAVNVVERMMNLLALRGETRPIDMIPMFQEVFQMLKKALDAFLGRDCFTASQVVSLDDQVDRLHQNNYHTILQKLKGEDPPVEALLDWLNISRNLERMADCCTNIGEDVLYLEQGKILRHIPAVSPDENEQEESWPVKEY
ncbi:MAG: phosphate signaling complex protein PhoU [Planctomycetia bacterium]|nr:phosphate signaling complex protein PhoU [Planctomycetia bacterium]